MEVGIEICSCPPKSVALVGENNEERQQAMEHEGKAVQQRLRDELQQLWTENALFQRLMYKNKNQHRRCLYFRRLSQVQKHMKLLQSLGLDGIVESSSLYLPSAGPADDLDLAHSLTTNQRTILKGMMRSLLGAARLLEQTVEPVLKASLEIAGLLGSSFFMPFALTNFSCLARFRVLIIQIMYDVVMLSNLLAATVYDELRKKRKDGTQWKTEDLPSILECSWKGDRLRLSGKTVVLPPVEDSMTTDQEPETPSHPMVQWVVDDRSGKIIDLKRNDLFGEMLVIKGETPPSAVPAETLESIEPCPERDGDSNVPLSEVADSHMDSDATAPQDRKDTENATATESLKPSVVSTLYGEGHAEFEPEANREVGEPNTLVSNSKRKGIDSEDGEPKKRVAYLAVGSGRDDSGPTVSKQETTLPHGSGGPLTTDSEKKSQRMRTDEFFDMLLGRTGNKSLF